MNKRILLTVVIVGLAAVFSYSLWGPKPDLETTSQPKSNQAPVKFRAVIDVEFDKTLNHYELTQSEGITVLEALKKATKGQVEIQGEGEKAFVTSINGRQAKSSKKEYWSLSINDKLSEVGAGVYKIKNGDKIRWEIQTY